MRRNLVVPDNQPSLCRELADERCSIGSVDTSNGAWGVGVERRDFRQVVGVGEEDATEGAKTRGRDEQHDDRDVPGDPPEPGDRDAEAWR